MITEIKEIIKNKFYCTSKYLMSAASEAMECFKSISAVIN